MRGRVAGAAALSDATRRLRVRRSARVRRGMVASCMHGCVGGIVRAMRQRGNEILQNKPGSSSFLVIQVHRSKIATSEERVGTLENPCESMEKRAFFLPSAGPLAGIHQKRHVE